MKHQGQYVFSLLQCNEKSVILSLNAYSLRFSAELMTESLIVIGQRIGQICLFLDTELKTG